MSPDDWGGPVDYASRSLSLKTLGGHDKTNMLPNLVETPLSSLVDSSVAGFVHSGHKMPGRDLKFLDQESGLCRGASRLDPCREHNDLVSPLRHAPSGNDAERGLGLNGGRSPVRGRGQLKVLSDSFRSPSCAESPSRSAGALRSCNRMKDVGDMSDHGVEVGRVRCRQTGVLNGNLDLGDGSRKKAFFAGSLREGRRHMPDVVMRGIYLRREGVHRQAFRKHEGDGCQHSVAFTHLRTTNRASAPKGELDDNFTA